jgi:hypothetical protein
MDVRRRRWVMCVGRSTCREMFVYGILMDSGLSARESFTVKDTFRGEAAHENAQRHH